MKLSKFFPFCKLTSLHKDVVEVVEPRPEPGPVHFAFRIDLIREKILSYVVNAADDESMCMKTLQNCRLVNRTWFQYISSFCQHWKQPLLYLSLGPNVLKNRKLLKHFKHNVLPIKIRLESDFFIQANFKNLTKCLISVGSVLVELDICFPVNGGSMLFPQGVKFNLPILQKITVRFQGRSFRDEFYPENVRYLLQPIFQGCKELKEFNVPFQDENWYFRRGFPELNVCFGALTLPITLTAIDMSYNFISDDDLENLVVNPFSMLKKLEITQTKWGWGVRLLNDGLVFRILQNCCQTLESLTIGGGHLNKRFSYDEYSFYSFPVMPRLQSLEISSICWKLERNICLQKCLPNLKSMKLDNISSAELRQWTTNQCLGSVKYLFVRLDNPWSYHPDYLQEVDDEVLLGLKNTFPNIATLNVSGADVACIELLLGEINIDSIDIQACEDISTSTKSLSVSGYGTWQLKG